MNDGMFNKTIRIVLGSGNRNVNGSRSIITVSALENRRYLANLNGENIVA